MNYGLYTSASGLSVEMARQDMLANNLANVNTTAYKPDVFAVREREAARQEDGLASMPSNALLERLGGGVMPVGTRLGMKQAPLERTGSPFDVAIEGEGFFSVRVGEGPEGVRLTRDGRLALGADGRLVTAAGGHEALDMNDQPITLDPGLPIQIRSGGAIVQGGTVVGQLGLTTVGDPSMLEKEGGGLLRAGSVNRIPATGRIMQEFLETSGTDAVTTMTEISSSSRAVAGATSLMGQINQMMGQAINTLGRTA